jgi:hypothetical protein
MLQWKLTVTRRFWAALSAVIPGCAPCPHNPDPGPLNASGVSLGYERQARPALMPKERAPRRGSPTAKLETACAAAPVDPCGDGYALE